MSWNYRSVTKYFLDNFFAMSMILHKPTGIVVLDHSFRDNDLARVFMSSHVYKAMGLSLSEMSFYVFDNVTTTRTLIFLEFQIIS